LLQVSPQLLTTPHDNEKTQTSFAIAPPSLVFHNCCSPCHCYHHLLQRKKKSGRMVQDN